MLGALLALSAGSWWAGAVGAFAPTPEKNPPSIREGSMRGALTGRAGTRYFVGGGLHRGK